MSGIVLLILRFLLVVSLYAFLGWALFTIWRDLQHQSELLAALQPPPVTLQVVDNVTSFHFTIPEVIIGRDPACDCLLEDQTVSIKHTRLSYHQNQWWVEDLNSTNGTFLNQEPITSPVVITNGDQLRCGQVLLTISMGERFSR
jgi:pSer/pThr/pTyr-binding forkhead associated (FHA) protein